MQGLSESCRTELEAAMTQEGADLSDKCRTEVQAVVTAHAARTGGANRAARPAAVELPSGPFYTNPAFHVLAFVTAATTGAVGFCWYVNKQIKEYQRLHPKKKKRSDKKSKQEAWSIAG